MAQSRNLPQRNTGTGLGARTRGRQEEGGGIQENSIEGARASAESCKMSRSLSRGKHCQAREQDVHKHGGVRKRSMFRNYKYFSIATDRVPGGGGWQVAENQVPDHIPCCHDRECLIYR